MDGTPTSTKARHEARTILKGLLGEHLRVDDEALAKMVFPGSDAATPLTGLVAGA
jgi:uncharacterized protein (DUF1501 family)